MDNVLQSYPVSDIRHTLWTNNNYNHYNNTYYFNYYRLVILPIYIYIF